MKKMIKILMASMMCLSLVGCSSSSTEETYKVMIVKQMDHASLDEIATSIEERLDALEEEKGIEIEYETVSGQGDATMLKQYGDQAVSEGYDVVIPIATMAAQQVATSCKGSDTKVVYAAISDPESAGLTGLDYVTGTSDALNTEVIINMMLSANSSLKKVGLLYSKNETNSTTSIKEAKSILDKKGIQYIEYTANNNEEALTAVKTAISDQVEAVFTPTDNIIMASELSIAPLLTDANIPHYTGADSFVKKGGFVTCGVNYVELGQKTADVTVDVLLNGMDDIKDYYKMDGGIVTVNKEVAKKLGIDAKKVFSDYGEIVEVETEE